MLNACLSASLPVFLSASLSAWSFTCLRPSRFAYLTCLSACLLACLPVCLSAFLTPFLLAYLSRFVCLSTGLPTSLLLDYCLPTCLLSDCLLACIIACILACLVARKRAHLLFTESNLQSTKREAQFPSQARRVGVTIVKCESL